MGGNRSEGNDSQHCNLEYVKKTKPKRRISSKELAKLFILNYFENNKTNGNVSRYIWCIVHKKLK